MYVAVIANVLAAASKYCVVNGKIIIGASVMMNQNVFRYGNEAITLCFVNRMRGLKDDSQVF